MSVGDLANDHGVANDTVGGDSLVLESGELAGGSVADIGSAENAEQAVTLLATAVTILGTVQADVGRGQNRLQFAIGLATTQITNLSGRGEPHPRRRFGAGSGEPDPSRNRTAGGRCGPGASQLRAASRAGRCSEGNSLALAIWLSPPGRLAGRAFLVLGARVRGYEEMGDSRSESK